MIKPALVRDDDVMPFLDAHIQLDLQHISQCCGESIDDCLLLLHDVIHNFNIGMYSFISMISLIPIHKHYNT